MQLVGNRPCGNVAQEKMDALKAAVAPAVERVIGKPLSYHTSSTDCNIPHSLGIPAMAVGVRQSGGTHTREEWLNKASLIPGLEIAIRVFAAVAEVAL